MCSEISTHGRFTFWLRYKKKKKTVPAPGIVPRSFCSTANTGTHTLLGPGCGSTRTDPALSFCFSLLTDASRRLACDSLNNSCSSRGGKTTEIGGSSEGIRLQPCTVTYVFLHANASSFHEESFARGGWMRSVMRKITGIFNESIFRLDTIA